MSSGLEVSSSLFTIRFTNPINQPSRSLSGLGIDGSTDQALAFLHDAGGAETVRFGNGGMDHSRTCNQSEVSYRAGYFNTNTYIYDVLGHVIAPYRSSEGSEEPQIMVQLTFSSYSGPLKSIRSVRGLGWLSLQVVHVEPRDCPQLKWTG